MTTLLIGIGLLAFALVSYFKREWGVYLIILLLPTYQIRFAAAGFPTTFLEGMILILAAVELAGLARSRKLRQVFQEQIVLKLRRNLPILLFLLAAAVSIFVSPVTAKAAGIFKAYFFESVLFYFLVLLIINTEKKLARLVQSLALLVLYLSIFGIYQFVTLAHLPFSWWAVDVASRRISSLLNHPNALALLLGPIISMLLVLLLTARTWMRNKLLIVSVSFGLVALYLTFSRAAWLALGATIVVLGLATVHKKKIFAAAILAAILVLAIPYSRGKLFELVRGTDPSQQNRYVLWNAAADIIKHRPIYGAGLMGFHEAYKAYPLGPDRVVQNYPHNFFLNFWVEIGAVGLLAMLGLLYMFAKKIRYLWRGSWRPAALASAAGMLVILLHGQVDVSYFKNDLSVLFWLIYAIPNLKFLI